MAIEAEEDNSLVGSIGLTSKASQTSVEPISLRCCITCTNEIPAARLRVKPNASQCAPCLTATGDVSLLKEFDGVYFTHNRALETQMRRAQTCTPNAKILTEVTDSPLVKDQAPEIAADARSRCSVSSIVNAQVEEVNECAG